MQSYTIATHFIEGGSWFGIYGSFDQAVEGIERLSRVYDVPQNRFFIFNGNTDWDAANFACLFLENKEHAKLRNSWQLPH